MTTHSIDDFATLKSNTRVITPNGRLSRFFSCSFNHWQRSSGKKQWVEIPALPIADWIEQIWFENTLTRETLINDAELVYMWQQIIQEQITTPLLNIRQTAKIAVDAFRIMMLWQVPENEADFEMDTDWHQFFQWLRRFHLLCRKNSYVSSCQLPDRIIHSLDQGKKCEYLPSHVTLLGFDDIPPVIQLLLDRLKSHVEIEYKDLSTRLQDKQRYVFPDFPAELNAMVQWAKTEYQTNPDQTIGCIIPGLAKKRSTIEKTFLKAFALKEFVGLADTDEQPFNISAGTPLADFSVIQSAISLLKLNHSHLTLQEVQFLLRSPFIVGYFREYGKRSRLEKKIRHLQTQGISMDFFLKLLDQEPSILHKALQQMRSVNHGQVHSIEDWLKYINQKLEAAGWPGERELSSKNFQLVLRFREVLNELPRFSKFKTGLDYREFLTLLYQQLQDMPFQMKTDVKPIQILGSLEAAGMIFDRVWIMEMNDSQWPAAANPNPFIPHFLQRKYQVPHSTADRELNFSTLLLQRYLKSARFVFLSHAQQNDEQELNCSRLVHSIPVTEYPYPKQNLLNFNREIKPLQSIDDSMAPEITDEELKTVRGGSSILALQSACPFRAFATHRLKAKRLPSPEPGLTALQRGAIVHAALDLFWQQIKSQKHLLSLKDEHKEKIVEECSRAAILSISAFSHPHSQRLSGLEIKRVTGLLTQWLDLETKRDEFTVLATEAEVHTCLKSNSGEIPLTLRIDRIDQMSGGALILIDYKTNNVSINRWFGERPDEPQLPLYALVYPEKIDAIVFGQIKSGEFDIKGVGNSSATGFGIRDIATQKSGNATAWDTQLQQWQVDLGRLTDEFIQGVAKVDPKKGLQTCTFCDLQSLCRIGDANEQTL